MNEENMTTNPERVPRPEEVLEDAAERPAEQMPSPLRCQVGSKTDGGGCPRDAVVRPYPEPNLLPVMCEEHAHAYELGMECSEWGMVEEVTLDWLRLARAWESDALEQLAVNAHESAKQELLKAEAKADLAREIADAPRKGTESPNLTPEQNEKLVQLMRRSDAFNDAYTALEDAPEGTLRPESLRGALATLAEERDKASEEVSRCREEIGLRPAAE